MIFYANRPVLEIAISCYPWEIEHHLDELCALYEYFVNIAPVDRMIEEVELGIKKPSSLHDLSLKNFTNI